jgi:hypothetical protein
MKNIEALGKLLKAAVAYTRAWEADARFGDRGAYWNRTRTRKRIERRAKRLLVAARAYGRTQTWRENKRLRESARGR